MSESAGSGLTPIGEVAGQLGVHVTTLYRHLKRGRFRRYRKPGDQRTYVRLDEVTAALSGQEMELRLRMPAGSMLRLIETIEDPDEEMIEMRGALKAIIAMSGVSRIIEVRAE